jgi:predicted Fe-Mo cluster-binding NifX family protein
MKIAVCSQSNNAQSNVDSRFGRAPFFAVYDDAVNAWEFLENQQNLQAAQGAGIQAAQTIVDADVNVLIAANVGPKAMAALNAGGIAVFEADPSKTIQQALDDYKAGTLTQLQQSNVEGHWV